MVGAILILIGRISHSFILEDANSFEPIDVLTILNFCLLFGRLFIGDTNFNALCAEFGVNNKNESQYFLLKNKTIIDSIFLFVQSALFVFLAYFLSSPERFFIFYLIVLFINICWLSVQLKSFKLYLSCIVRKSEKRLKGYSKNRLIKCHKTVSKIDSIVELWLVNNFFFLFFGLACYLISVKYYGPFLEVGLILMIFNSAIDLRKTFSIYSRPFNILL